MRTYGERAGVSLPTHPHMLRHACGFALADQGADTRLMQDPLGHRKMQHTVMDTATTPARCERLWRETACWEAVRILPCWCSHHGHLCRDSCGTRVRLARNRKGSMLNTTLHFGFDPTLFLSTFGLALQPHLGGNLL
jgi:hypothetical protein